MNQALEIELQLPLTWQEAEEGDPAPDNQAAFLLINSFAEATPKRGEDDAEAGELQRIEQKLDLVIQLLIPLAQRNHTLPPSRPVRLSASHIAWQEQPGPEVQQRIQIRLFLEPRVPYPIELLGHVQRIEDGWIHARIERMSENDAHALERWIFRYHRRQVAMERRSR